MENQPQTSYKTTSQALGIAGFVLGILTLLISFIPCLGVLALVIGIAAIVISIIGLLISIKHQQSKVFVIVALLLALIGSIVAGLQYFVLTKLAKDFPITYPTEVPYTVDPDTIYSNANGQDSIFYQQDAVKDAVQ